MNVRPVLSTSTESTEGTSRSGGRTALGGGRLLLGVSGPTDVVDVLVGCRSTVGSRHEAAAPTSRPVLRGSVTVPQRGPGRPRLTGREARG